VVRNIYLIRHAAVRKLKEKSYIGSTELRLSSSGIYQAKRLSEFFSRVRLQAIYCSSMIRSENTAEIIAGKCNKPYIAVEGLNEISLGDWEGKSFREIKENFPEEFIQRGLDIFNYKTPGGESFCQLQERAYKAFEKILYDSAGDILIVGHSGTNKVILSKILGRSLKECFNMEQKYGCINIIKEYEDNYTVIKNMMVS
jgi:broad specificity phosphatase PhoE